MKSNPITKTDFYKIGHVLQYPVGTTKVYSNLTARKSRLPGTEYIVFFGLQYVIKELLMEDFKQNFFQRPKEEVIAEYKRRMETSIGPLKSYQHIEDLHDLGYLPVEIKALPEGSRVPIGIPCLTVVNTHPEFFWVTNFLESILSNMIWQPITSATIADVFKQLLLKYAEQGGMPKEFVDFQGHDFSMRGMGGFDATCTSGAGHLLSFKGTDSIPAIDFLEEFYGADATKELVGGSIPATEHSVMSAGTGVHGEFQTFKDLITVVYPESFVSIVSDTFNLWEVLTDFLPQLKNEVLARPNGKVVIRPDSGDPVDIICGTKTYNLESALRWPYGKKDPQEGNEVQVGDTTIIWKNGEWVLHPKHKGVIELLWDVFGGTINDKGLKVLDSHVGAIYGDSINLQRATEISERLIAKGFAPQCVFGIGSFTYQYNTRDTFGMAVKATYIELGDKGIPIFKDPITDDGTKKSAKGLLRVDEIVTGDQVRNRYKHSTYELTDQVSWDEEKKGALKTVFLNGKLVRETTLAEIRKRLS